MFWGPTKLQVRRTGPGALWAGFWPVLDRAGCRVIRSSLSKARRAAEIREEVRLWYKCASGVAGPAGFEPVTPGCRPERVKAAPGQCPTGALPVQDPRTRIWLSYGPVCQAGILHLY